MARVATCVTALSSGFEAVRRLLLGRTSRGSLTNSRLDRALTGAPARGPDSRKVDRELAEAILAQINRLRPDCEREVRRRLPELTGEALETEIFRCGLRASGYALTKDAYQYIQRRYEEIWISSRKIPAGG